ncbi:Clp1-like protein [Rhodotorula toruloides ATCC 204091]|uniref:Clp1-like protein n=2 Tax=Rhodotorula toruloides TaxID=5286 RepID=A0A2T0A426_RHOTO|nr:Clp1-like protein [Rhodotorula toruloides ATCC 204091]KAK4332478.1 Clp1-like protein [Rhodotorula toruloides]PRQ72774.1 Clp1-like protein [Rhodotorula toruloides]
MFPPLRQSPGRLQVPYELPRPPAFPRVSLDDLELDEDLADSKAPLEFVLSVMRNMAADLLQASESCEILDEPPIVDESTQTSFFRCKPPPAHLPTPTHILDLDFSDTGERYTTPVHGLLWACQSPKMSRLSRRQDPPSSASSTDGSLFLPRVSLSISHRSAWPFLHRYLYDGSSAHLLDSLLAQPPSRASTSRANEHEQHLARLERIREVWLDAVSLELSDRQLWETMRRAWGVVVAGLREVARARPAAVEGPGENAVEALEGRVEEEEPRADKTGAERDEEG